MIYGDLRGIRNYYIEELESLYNFKIDKNVVISKEVLKKVSYISLKINKEIYVVILRTGVIHSICIGRNEKLIIADDIRERKKLSGYRVVYTKLDSYYNLSSSDIEFLRNLKIDAISIINVGREDSMDKFSLGFLENDGVSLNEIVFDDVEKYLNFDIYSTIVDIEKKLKLEIYSEKEELAVLIGCDSEESLDELKELAFACNVNICDTFFQKREKVDGSYYVGKGKFQEIMDLIYGKNVNVLIFDGDLTSAQISNLEQMSKIKVIDRTNLILDIFARRAKSKLSKYQVELAQLKYRYSKLRGLGFVLNRTGGGIGTRGPGEKKLEINRRHIRDRISYLQNQLRDMKFGREIQRLSRIKNKIPQVSIAGYTNAGKSSLRNCIYSILEEEIYQNKLVFADDMLFATLDTSARKIVLPNKTVIALIDTIGFIRKLPHDLVEAFKSTFEEVLLSDLLIHVVDISSKTWESEIEVTDSVLKEIGMDGKIKKILVFNKIDKLQEDEIETIKDKAKEHYNIDETDVIFISVKEKNNIESLISAIENKLDVESIEVFLNIPYSDYSVLNSIYEHYTINEKKDLETGIFVSVKLPKRDLNKYEKYLISDLEN